jgi:hypothetical protein
MRRAWLSVPVLALMVAAIPASGQSDQRVENLALCRDSWLDWKNSAPSALESFGVYFRSAFAHNDGDAFVTPKAPIAVDGLNVAQVFPQSLGMGLGFSVVVDASFDVAKQALERDLGEPLRSCDAGDGMRTCELPVAEQRTIILASNDPANDQTTLVGCYYFYEK